MVPGLPALAEIVPEVVGLYILNRTVWGPSGIRHKVGPSPTDTKAWLEASGARGLVVEVTVEVENGCCQLVETNTGL